MIIIKTSAKGKIVLLRFLSLNKVFGIKAL